MTSYLIVFVLIVLFAKCESAVRAISGLDIEFAHIKTELICYFLATVMYSILQVLVFAPSELLATFYLNDTVTVRIYLLVDLLNVLAAGYLLLSLFDVRWHKHLGFFALIGGYVAFSSYQFLFSDSLISTSAQLGQMLVHVPSADGGFLGIMWLLVAPTTLWVLAIVSTYWSTRSTHTRMLNSLLLIAFVLLVANQIFNLLYTVPLVHCLHGIVFYTMLVLVVHRSGFFDIRIHLPGTLEQRMERRLNQHSQIYLNEKTSHDDFMLSVNRELLAYKLSKFEQSSDPVSMEALAKNLRVKPSRLLQQLADLKISRTRSKN